MIYFMDSGASGPSDPDFASVILLLGFEGADASTTFTDSSTYARSASVNGTAQIDTAQFKFGSSSGLFPGGTGNVINFADSTDFYLEAGDFTIDLHYRPAAIGTRQFLCGQGDVSASSVRNLLEITAAGKFRYLTDGSSAVSVVGTTTLVANTWYHLRAVKSGSDFHVFVDGNLDTTVNSGATFSDFAGNFYIGRCGLYTLLPTNGHIDEFRITKGVARSTSSFTAPTAAYPRS